MRPAGKGPLDSLYFDYPRFAARRVPKLDGAHGKASRADRGRRADRHDRGAGAGALRHPQRADRSQGHLQRRQPRDLHRAARACTFWSGSARSRRLLEKALGWRFGRSYYRGEQIFRLEMPQPPDAKNICRCTICSSSTSKIPARRGRGQRPHRHALAERAYRHRAPRRRRICSDFIAGGRLLGSTPSMCWPPTARARRSAPCSGCG